MNKVWCSFYAKEKKIGVWMVDLKRRGKISLQVTITIVLKMAQILPCEISPILVRTRMYVRHFDGLLYQLVPGLQREETKDESLSHDKC